MSRRKTTNTRDLGLEIATICGRYFLKLEYLHYGYWNNGLEIDIANLHTAQESYTNFLISHIPKGVQTILDVGCGTGKIAKLLTGMGYLVDCVSPSPFLSEQASSLLGSTSRIFRCPYEQLDIERQYDLVLFSESFQYVALEKGLEQTTRFLNNGGYLLICDVFKKDVEGNGAIGGGHKVSRFFEMMKRHPFKIVVDEDITEQTAPNIEILDDAVKNVIAPALDSGLGFLSSKYPLTTKLVRWKYRKKIRSLCEKYLNGRRTNEDFKRFKTYRLFLYRKICPS